jgi:hypothetical protein
MQAGAPIRALSIAADLCVRLEMPVVCMYLSQPAAVPVWFELLHIRIHQHGVPSDFCTVDELRFTDKRETESRSGRALFTTGSRTEILVWRRASEE